MGIVAAPPDPVLDRICAFAIELLDVPMLAVTLLDQDAQSLKSQTQLEFLPGHGCDLGQGFLFGKPMPPSGVPSFLRDWARKEMRRPVFAILKVFLRR
jgi:sensor c-di-GMP phosphodiesterase-like protein